VKSPFTGKPESVQLSYLQLSNSVDSENEHTDTRALVSTLSINNVLTIFISLLAERRIIFHSSSVTTLSAAVQAAMDLISPLSWQHIYIPVLPPSMISYCCAPMPFVIGVLSSQIPEVNSMPIDEVLMVDLDKDELYGINDFGLFPPFVRDPLIKALKNFQTAIKKLKLGSTLDSKVRKENYFLPLNLPG
jgi:hypothetical protein